MKIYIATPMDPDKRERAMAIAMNLRSHNHQVCMDAARDRWFIKNIRCKVELFYKDFYEIIDQCILNDQIGFKNGQRIYIGEDVIRETAEKYKDVLAELYCDRAPYEVCNWSYYNED